MIKFISLIIIKKQKNYKILSCTVIEKYRREIKVEYNNGNRLRVPRGEYFLSEAEAKQYCYRIANNVWKEECVKLILDDLPKELSPNFYPRLTSNPLRFAERNMLFSAQGNVWGSEENEQKMIQIIALTFEDIEVLIKLCKS